jgi:phosphoribosylamine--glycine ligase
LVNVLVVGSGGREHSLEWKLSKSPKVEKVFVAPGNGGTKNNVPISVDKIDELAEFAQKNNCFTVVGPEAPLALGIVDKFNEKNLKIFGPTKQAAQLESSKIWAKDFMKRNDIPTAKYEIFGDAKKAEEYVNEERIDGVEASFIALSDGNSVIPMATSQDHKRIYDCDKGPNTGGMGAYSPTPVIDEHLSQKIQKNIINKTLEGMKKEGISFKGFLYAGIMIKNDEPYVLEFNVRMGDPECQPIMMRMNSDLYEYLYASSERTLSKLPPISWTSESAVCVILASKGYPEAYPKNEEIALGDSLENAITNAYSAVNNIIWPNKYCRKDIGKKGLSYR